MKKCTRQFAASLLEFLLPEVDSGTALSQSPPCRLESELVAELYDSNPCLDALLLEMLQYVINETA